MPVHPLGDPQLFNSTGSAGHTSFFGGQSPLPVGVGYAVVVGFGLLFGVLTTLLVWSDITFGGIRATSEEFTTAGRQIKTGLIAVDVVSHWTWAATLLQSSNVAYQYGISGPFWYAAGAAVQILLFGILAVEVKRRAPTAHTILEIINARWGLKAHLTFFFFCIMTNMVVTAMLFLGGAAVLNALTNMNIYAAAFLMPAGVIIYTVAGLKATFLASYLHTIVIYLALCIFSMNVYATGPKLGSPGKVWENLVQLSTSYPVSGNRSGSYLTMYSQGGLFFGIINLIGNFGAVFVDQAYWQTAIAAKPSSAHYGYFLGGLMWFTIPFTLATTMGLGALALDLPISMAEADAGLVAPALAVTIMGQGGALLIVTMVFMAVTSAGSAELIAVSSLITYDVYRTYLNREASGKDILLVSRATIVVFGCLMGVLASALLALQISLGYVYLAMGVLIGSAVIPIGCCLSWKKCTAGAATLGALGGLAVGVGFWLLTAYLIDGTVSISSTAKDLPMLVGNVASIGSSAFILLVVSFMHPDSYDWESMKLISMVDPVDDWDFMSDFEMRKLTKARKFIWMAAGGTSVILAIIWPVFTLIPPTFDRTYFYVWVIVSIVWGMIATVVCTLLPIWEARQGLWSIVVHMVTCQPRSVEDITQSFQKAKPVPLVPGGNPIVAQEMIAHRLKAEKSVYGGYVHSGTGSRDNSPKSLTPKTLSPKTSDGVTSNSHITLAARLTLQHLSSPSSSLGKGITREKLREKLTGPAPPSDAALPRTTSEDSASDSAGFPLASLRATHSATTAGPSSGTEYAPPIRAFPPSRSSASPLRYQESAYPRYPGYPGGPRLEVSHSSGALWHAADQHAGMQTPVGPPRYPLHHSLSASLAGDWQRTAATHGGPQVPTSYFATGGPMHTRDDMDVYAAPPHPGPPGYPPQDGYLWWQRSNACGLPPEAPFNAHCAPQYFQDVRHQGAVWQYGDAHMPYEQAHAHAHLPHEQASLPYKQAHFPQEQESSAYEHARLRNPTPSAPVWMGEPEIAPHNSSKPPRSSKALSAAQRQPAEHAAQAPGIGRPRYNRSVSLTEDRSMRDVPRAGSGPLEHSGGRGVASLRSASPAVSREGRKREQ